MRKQSLSSTLRLVWQMALADIRERTRRYRFLVMLGLVLWVGYLSASGQFRMRVPPDYLGVINSAWVGATMTITVTLLLGWFGFYLIKGAVSRDYETGVGQIMATTPLSRPLYTLGKWFSNFLVLALMILILAVVGVIMNLVAGTAGFNLWALVAPLLLIALPCMAIVAAIAVLFETISWLRGGIGNVVYFFLFLFGMAGSAEAISSGKQSSSFLDFAGFQVIGSSVSQAAQAAYPESAGGFAFSISELGDPKLFLWEGIDWTAEIILPRFFFLMVAIGIVLLASVFFDRFNPARILRGKRTRTQRNDPQPKSVRESVPVAAISLTPITSKRNRIRFDALFAAELRLFLKGQPWWWFAIALGLMVAQWSANAETIHLLLILSWTWPVLILSGMGCRETRYNTRQIIFAAPHPLMMQLPAAWLAAFTILALLGSGALARFILAGETINIMGWITGAFFIPSLALASGVLTGSSKTFEAIYVLWMYMLTQKVAQLDFIGMSAGSLWFLYPPLGAILLAAAVLARRWQLTNSGTSAGGRIFPIGGRSR